MNHERTFSYAFATHRTPAPATLAAVLTVALVAGCASAPPRPKGAVVPMEGGRYQSVVKAGDTQAALKTFGSDAEITCAKPQSGTRMPWEAKPAPAKYAVISQTLKDKNGKKLESTGNAAGDVGVTLLTRRYGLEDREAVEATTVFKCE